MPVRNTERGIFASGLQPYPPGENPYAMTALTGGLAAVGLAGFIPTKRGRVWDAYVAAVRQAESYSPGAVLRTFRVSETFSIFETARGMRISPQAIESQGIYGDYLRKVVGDVRGGVEITPTRGIFAAVRDKDRNVVGYALNAASGTQRGRAIADFYARASGIKVPEGLSMSEGVLSTEWQTRHRDLGVSFDEWKRWDENIGRQPRIPLMSRLRSEVNLFGRRVPITPKWAGRLAKLETANKFLSAHTATTISRFSNLLFETPVIGEYVEKIPLIKRLRIPYGTPTEMIGGLAKRSLQLYLGWKGLEYYDYLRANNQPAAVAAGTIGGAALGGYLTRGPTRAFGTKGLLIGAAAGLYTSLSPRFEHGLFHGLSTYMTDANILRARFSDVVGLTDQLQSQNQITPGSISAGAVLAPTIMGGLGGVGIQYGRAVKHALASGGRWSDPGLVDRMRYKLKEDFAEKWAQRAPVQWLQRKFPRTLGKMAAGLGTPGRLGAFIGAATGMLFASTTAALSGNFLAAVPGLNLLGTDETEEQLRRWYSGEEEVPIRKGRWWEFGRSTSYGGGRIEYFRPHAVARLKSRASQKGMYGSEEERWEYDPILHPFKALFGPEEWKYHYEIKHQYDRPAPLTGTYFEDVPVIGPLLAATLGKLIKPRKLVRPEEWMLGEGKFVHHPGRPESEPAYELGGLAPGAPVAPEEPTQLFNELMYRRREAIGLLGFTEGALQKELTGREEVFQNLQTLGVMGRETGAEYWLWKHLNVGGALGASEVVRRHIPHRRRYLEDYNPLKADLPSWMPEDYFLDYQHGNPWEKIPEAEIRLPGPGLAALHPELEGVDPEHYPLAWRAKVLGDVAMWSSEYRTTMRQAMARRGEMSEAHQRMLDTIREQVQAKKIRREFEEYKFREEELKPMEVTVKEVIDPRTILTEELGEMRVALQGVGATENMAKTMEAARSHLEGKQIQLYTPALEGRRYRMGAGGGTMRAVAMLGEEDYGRIMAEEGHVAVKELVDEFRQLRYTPGQRLAGSIGEAYTRAMMTPLENLTPASPMSKFYNQRSAIEEYVATEAVGTGSAFWDKPIENFLAPAKEMTEYKMGDDEIPFGIRKRRAITEYFDKLQYVKEQKLAEEALAERDYDEYAEHLRESKKTVFGVNPFANPANVMMALPRRERDFFTAFVEAKTEEDREAIMALVPKDIQRLYTSQWMKQERDAITAKKDAGIATKEDDAALAKISTAAKSEGFGSDEQLEELWMRETGGDIPFAEWLRQKKLEQYFRVRSLPGPDWIGWHPSVDLQDIEVKYVQNEGLDHHEFDLWGDRVRSLARKPYLAEAELSLTPSDQLTAALEDEAQMVANARIMGSFMRDKSSDIIVNRINADIDSRFDMEIADGREGIVKGAYEQMGMKILRDY